MESFEMQSAFIEIKFPKLDWPSKLAAQGSFGLAACSDAPNAFGVQSDLIDLRLASVAAVATLSTKLPNGSV